MPRESFLLRRVEIRNYKSLDKCNVELGNFVLLVGRNGSGKSNFLDAIRFVSDALETSLDHALKSRGGIAEVRRISTGHPRNFSIGLELDLDGAWARYAFEVASQPKGGFIVRDERLEIVNYANEVQAGYHVKDGQIQKKNVDSLPQSSPDRLLLVVASGLPEFRPVYDALLAMGFYNLNPQSIREIQKPDAGELLRRDGANLASVVARLAEDRPQVKHRIQEYLEKIVPEIADFERAPVGHQETLVFRQRVTGAQHPWRFFAGSMSDGTLRTLGILAAAMQLVDRNDPIRLVGIEEPETALHPAATGALMDALREASESTQVIATTHSPDLLDRLDPESDTLLVVVAEDGTTRIGPADDASLDAVKSHLYSAGDLLRMDQLQPRPPVTHQPSLFVDVVAQP